MTCQYPFIYRRTCCPLAVIFKYSCVIYINEIFRGKLAGATPTEYGNFQGFLLKISTSIPFSYIWESPPPRAYFWLVFITVLRYLWCISHFCMYSFEHLVRLVVECWLVAGFHNRAQIPVEHQLFLYSLEYLVRFVMECWLLFGFHNRVEIPVAYRSFLCSPEHLVLLVVECPEVGFRSKAAIPEKCQSLLYNPEHAVQLAMA